MVQTELLEMQKKELNKMYEIDWTDEKISRIWNYYAKNPSYQSQYFSYHSGKHIIEYVDKHIKLKNMKTFLDFGWARDIS